MAALARSNSALTLRSAGLASKESLTQCLFIRFHDNPAIYKFYKDLKDVDSCQSTFELYPHLSLLYQILPKLLREVLIRETTIPWQEIVFDELWAMAIPEKLRTLKDFVGWQHLLTSRLASEQNIGTIDKIK